MTEKLHWQSFHPKSSEPRSAVLPCYGRHIASLMTKHDRLRYVLFLDNASVKVSRRLYTQSAIHEHRR